MKSLIGAFAALAVGLVALPASATTYLFSGTANPTMSGAGNILNYVDRDAPLTFEFTTSAPLAPSLGFLSRLSVPTSWTASGGSTASTIDSQDAGATLSTFQFSTDSSGNISQFNIHVHATSSNLSGADLNDSWDYQFQNFAGTSFERVELDHPPVQPSGHVFEDSVLICMNACGGSSGSFSRVEPPPGGGVPEPASWALMIGGFGLAGAELRRQRRQALPAV